MEKLLDQIKNIEFTTKENFSYDLERERGLISSYLDNYQTKLLEQDFEAFLQSGKSIVLNSFTGSLLFLKTPEQVDKIELEYKSEQNAIIARAIFLSDTKYTQNINWKMEGIFPHFNKYPTTVKIALMIVIGKIVRRICEYGKTHWAYMKILNSFKIHLIVDGTLESSLDVKTD